MVFGVPSEDFLKRLWIKNLPTQARAILSTSEANLADLAILADKIVEVADPSHINEVDFYKSESNINHRIQSIENKI